jgi:prevent-host-death family protein
MDIRQINATEAKNRFSELLDAAADHPVRIDRNGKAEVYVVRADDFESAQGAVAMARIDRLLAAKDPGAIAALTNYSQGKLGRQVAIDALKLKNYSQLLDALAHAGLESPHLPIKTEAEMVSALESVVHG